MSDQGSTSESRIHLPTYDGCFVCGQSHPSGLCARFYVGESGKVHAQFKPNQTQTGYLNMVHGGIISAFLDELIGWGICLASEMLCYTGELTIRFRKQVFAGQTYLGTADRPTRPEGKRYWDGRGELADESGNVLAEATGRYFLGPEALTRAFGEQLTYQPGDVPLFREPLVKPTP
jgi:acyl-coenzyme A thioesterase PaaI-like protein